MTGRVGWCRRTLSRRRRSRPPLDRLAVRDNPPSARPVLLCIENGAPQHKRLRGTVVFLTAPNRKPGGIHLPSAAVVSRRVCVCVGTGKRIFLQTAGAGAFFPPKIRRISRRSRCFWLRNENFFRKITRFRHFSPDTPGCTAALFAKTGAVSAK